MSRRYRVRVSLRRRNGLAIDFAATRAAVICIGAALLVMHEAMMHAKTHKLPFLLFFRLLLQHLHISKKSR